MLLMASSLMFFAENEAQPDKFANIPQAMWWSIITLTTVGYGDVFPVTAGGRLLAGVIAILGIGLFALPAGILGSGFMDEMNMRGQGPHAMSTLRWGDTRVGFRYGRRNEQVRGQDKPRPFFVSVITT